MDTNCAKTQRSWDKRPHESDTNASSKDAYQLIKLVLTQCYEEQHLTDSVVELLANLLSHLKSRHLQRYARKKLGAWCDTRSKNVTQLLIRKLVKLDKTLVALCMLIDWLQRTSKLDSMLTENEMPTKEDIIKLFTTRHIMTKTKQALRCTKISSNLLWQFVGPEEFKSILWPAIQKAMLRSPETVIEAVGCVLGSLKFGLNEYAEEFSKVFIPSLHCQSESTRASALVASRALASKISDAHSLEKVLACYFGVLLGAQGKLAVAAHKINVIKAIKELVVCQVPFDEITDIAIMVLNKSVTFLETEVHEGSLQECLEVMNVWSSKLGDVYPPVLDKFISKNLSNVKGSIRFQFYSLLATVFKEGRLQHLNLYIELILKQFDRLTPSQQGQNLHLEELLPLAIVVLNYSKVFQHRLQESTLNFILQQISDIDEKVISTLSKTSFCHMVEIVNQLILIPEVKVNKDMMRAAVLAVTYKEYEVRSATRPGFEYFLSQVNPIQVFNEFIPLLETTNGISGHVKEEIIRYVVRTVKCSWLKKDLERLAIALVRVSHHCQQLNYWITVVKNLGLDPGRLAECYWKQLSQLYIQNFDCRPTTKRIVQTFVWIAGKTFVADIVNNFQEVVDFIILNTVTEEEYCIFLTKEGELSDYSVLQLAEEKVKLSNMKRESKTYSYKEQMEEIELKRQLEEERRKAGKLKQFTPKQKEIIKIQLEKEAGIRNRLRVLDTKINNSVALLESALRGNIQTFSSYIPTLVTLIAKVMGNYLGEHYVTRFYKNLTSAVIQDEMVSYIAETTLRLCQKTQKHMEVKYEEPLYQASLKSLKRLNYLIKSGRFSCAEFSCCFLLFSYSVHKYIEETEVAVETLDCITTFLKNMNISQTNFYEPIPRVEICKLFYFTINGLETQVQQKCLHGLLALSKYGLNVGVEIEEQELLEHVNALKSNSTICRDAGIRSLTVLFPRVVNSTIQNQAKIHVYRERFDGDPDIAAVAEALWVSAGLKEDDDFIIHLLNGITEKAESVRYSSAKALGSLMQRNSSQIVQVLEKLISIYNKHLIEIPAVTDNFGRIIHGPEDRWEGRLGVGLSIKELTSFLPDSIVCRNMSWLVTVGLADRSIDVHCIFLEAAVEIVKQHGKNFLSEFIDIIETYLENREDGARQDHMREACVVLMGCLAFHIDQSDPRVKSIFTTLIETLSTPSEKVQEAVANCLPALVPALTLEAPIIMNQLLDKLMDSNSYGERRGAAYGLAGVVKGMGILSLKQYNIMNALAEGMQDKKNYRKREGCLMALELLCSVLGRLFEPYIVHVLPYLLQCLGDSNNFVREATENAAMCVMSRLSGHGVKLVLPSLISALNEDSWRTKCGSVDLLGRMAYCAPKQLSACLPMIVPKLIEVLGDSHIKVQEAATRALSLIGSVIRNPEIQSVVPILLGALQDPSKNTNKCMHVLLKTEFIHFVDPPSLALIMPVVQRAFQDRSTENRKMASQIIGNMYSLADHSDLAPYMTNVMPGLKMSLLDPVPEVRNIAAKALGSMAKGMGDKCYDEILPWLMKTLVSEVNAVDRSGAAQGLAEVIGALGEDKLHKFMPEIIKKAETDDIPPHVRDGYMMMFIYMPSVFEVSFIPYIGQILNPILKALADENEYVRETALRAGQRIVTSYADTAITLLLPELEKGLFDENWRIRYSSIQLLGDLLYKISGVSGKMSTESASDDDNFGTEHSQRVIVEALGLERRNRVLAGLYMGRSDVALMVRQAALHVWKVVVSNTPKTLREILQTLFNLLLGCLASSSHDKRQVAARTLGDLVRKLGEKILPEIIPLLEKGLESSNSAERQGVCIGLSEIMTSTSKDMVFAFVDNLVPTIKKGLCDASPDVRAAAAQTFANLHTTIGSRALEEIVPFLLKKLNSDQDGDNVLHGLSQLVLVKSKYIMPYIIPQLTSPPVNLKALVVLSSASGEAIAGSITKILPALVSVIKEVNEIFIREEELKACQQILLSITDDIGARVLIDELLQHFHPGDPDRVACITLLSVYCNNTRADLAPHVPNLLKNLILQMVCEEKVVVEYVADAISSVVKSLDGNQQLTYVNDVRLALRFAKSELNNSSFLPGLCTGKGVTSLLPVFREAILNGNSEAKEAAAQGMCELITLCSPDALKPSVIYITGPLIRILGDRYGPNVKISVIDTLTLLLSKAGQYLKAFLPQLQITFLKASSDGQRNVRLKAAYALGQLIRIHIKPDPLYQELISLVKQSDDIGLRDTALFALRCVISCGGEKMSDSVRKNTITLLTVLVTCSDDTTRSVAAGCLGSILSYVSATEFSSIMGFITSYSDNDIARHGKSSCIAVAMRAALASNLVYSEENKELIHKVTLEMLNSDKSTIVSNGVRVCGYIFLTCLQGSQSCPTVLCQPFSKTLNNPSNEVKSLTAQVSEVIARRIFPLMLPSEILKYLVASLINGTKEKNTMVKASCESALVCILHLRHGESTLNEYVKSVDPGLRETLDDVVNKVLCKMASQHEGKEPEIDDTILT